MLLVHGWPGDHTDYREVVPLISSAAEVVVADLRGFGESDKHPADYEVTESHLAHLVSAYAGAGAFTASIGWYRAGAGAVARSLAERAPEAAERISVPTTVLWYLARTVTVGRRDQPVTSLRSTRIGRSRTSGLVLLFGNPSRYIVGASP